MQLEFQGAARTVTGSMHVLRIGGKTILLDCGLFQGRREESNARNRTFPFGLGQLRYVRSVEESIKLNDLKGPCMIIAASGSPHPGRRWSYR